MSTQKFPAVCARRLTRRRARSPCERCGYRESDRTGRECLARSPANPRDEEEAAQPDNHEEAEEVEHRHEEEAQKEAECKDEKQRELVHRRSLAQEAAVTAEPNAPQKREQVLGDVPLPPRGSKEERRQGKTTTSQ